MSNQWLRLWHDMPNDPKWRTIAKISKQSIGDVIAVYLHVMVNASTNATERGRTKSLNSEDIASALDVEMSDVEAILSAMQGRVLDGDCLSGWNKRQPNREDGSAERAKEWRETKKRTQPNATERTENARKLQDTDTDTDTERATPIVPTGDESEILSAYREHLPHCQGVSVLNPKRRRRIRDAIKLARSVCAAQGWPYEAARFWHAYFSECARDPWMRGEVKNPNNPNWKQNLDVLIAEDRFAGVMDRAIERLKAAA